MMRRWLLMQMTARGALRRYGDMDVIFAMNPFYQIGEDNINMLEQMGISITQANNYFMLDYCDAYTPYDDDMILRLFNVVFAANRKKYQKLLSVYLANYNPIENYSMTETMDDLRTPDLSATTTSSGSSSTTSKINQQQITTDNPDNFTQTSIRSVNPYDGSGMRQESQNVVTDDGRRTTTVSYTGNPDTASSTTSQTTTATNTGTETNHHTGSRSGNIGVTTSQQMLESEIDLAAKMNFFHEIELDIAEKIFIGVW